MLILSAISDQGGKNMPVIEMLVGRNEHIILVAVNYSFYQRWSHHHPLEHELVPGSGTNDIFADEMEICLHTKN